MIDYSTCKHCGKMIVWAQTFNGRKIALENRYLNIMTDDGTFCRGREAHFAYCPNYKKAKR